MNNIFRGFGAVFYKEALHVRRDAGTLFFSLTMPLLQMFLLGFAIDTNIRQINTVVYNAGPPRKPRTPRPVPELRHVSRHPVRRQRP